jgi:hypothetical protein
MKGSIDALMEIAIHLSIKSRPVLGLLVTKIPICEIFEAMGFFFYFLWICKEFDDLASLFFYQCLKII